MLPIKNVPVTRRSCYVASSRHATHSVFVSFDSRPMRLSDFSAHQTLMISLVFLVMISFELQFSCILNYADHCQ